MPTLIRVVAAVIAALLGFSAFDADAAVLCAKRRRDGTLSATVRVREVCRPSQEQVVPEDVGISCSASTTTSTMAPSQCPTTSTILAPPCFGSQAGVCFNGQDCVMTEPSFFECQGPARCGAAQHYCGGECPLGEACDQRPVPAGCGPIGCACQ